VQIILDGWCSKSSVEIIIGGVDLLVSVVLGCIVGVDLLVNCFGAQNKRLKR